MKRKVSRSNVTSKNESQNFKKVDSVSLKKKMEKKSSRGTLMQKKTPPTVNTSKEAKSVEVPELVVKSVITDETLTPAQRRAKIKQ